MNVRTESARIGRVSDSLSTLSSAARASAALALLCGVVLAHASAVSPVTPADRTQLAPPTDSVPVAQLRVEPVAGGWHLHWQGFAAGAVVTPVLRVVSTDAADVVPDLVLPPVLADALGIAKAFVPESKDIIRGGLAAVGVTASGTGGGASNWGLLAIPGSAIGGWWLQTEASSAYYSAGSSHYCTNLGRVAPPPSAPQSTTLWAVVIDEDVASGASPEVVTAKSFDPATLPLNQIGLVLEGDWSLAPGHKLRLRVFDHEPSNAELTSGVLLWES